MKSEKLKIAAVIVILLIIIVGVAATLVMKNKNSAIVPYWTDMYISGSVAENEEDKNTVVLTFFSKSKMDLSNVSSVELKGISSYVNVDEFEVEDVENKDYDSQSISMNLKFLKEGEVETDTIILYYYDGTDEEYHPGEWVFDIGEKANVSMKEDASPGASSNSKQLVYDYRFSKNTMVKEIKIGKERKVEINKTQKRFAGDISVTQKAPLVIIRPKVTTTDGVYYGNPYYCGALDVTKEAIEESFQHAGK